MDFSLFPLLHYQSKTLMDQYFERIDQCSQSAKYPPRIRFMLRDLIELRRNGWVPRKSANTEAPVPMQQLRPDDDTRFNAFEPKYVYANFYYSITSMHTMIIAFHFRCLHTLF